ncbi:GNAT family N-acetyltransferase [Pseudomarimonas arenosa]|uniref:GNAT family N-acetyltransferase n=1 Tax=Pseudomarimonas arenosa TaxID=2774145 RepID=A0AAW3ZK14_9GAMM|nr:GNAT family N-acetyltransferase [Pseudomarimonas arenosa]MBD8526425.1 GNAT family N-acetyltransferase [Pseudomarimonas arenosa]
MSRSANLCSIRPARSTDADAISRLSLSFSDEFIVDSVAAQGFLDSLSAHAFRQRLALPDYAYRVAEQDGLLLGYLAMLRGSHLFQLFVDRAHHRRGVAKALWHHALRDYETDTMTVNASLNAVPVYRQFGFVAEGPLTVKQGVRYVPMCRIRSDLPALAPSVNLPV